MKLKLLTCSSLLILFIMLSCSLTAQDTWMKRGSDSLKYEMTSIGSEHNGKKVYTIKSTATKINGFGTYMQKMPAANYVGKRIMLTGFMRTDELSDWSGYWLRVDQEAPQKMLAFDNMQDRGLQGSSDWTTCTIVLDVPPGASSVSYGAILNGTGQLWFTAPEFTITDNNTPVTGSMVE